MFKAIANDPFNNMVFSAGSIDLMADDYDRLILAAKTLHPAADLSGPSAIGRFFNESPQTIKHWIARGLPKAKIKDLARRVGCRLDWLELDEGAMTDREQSPYEEVVGGDELRLVRLYRDSLSAQRTEIMQLAQKSADAAHQIRRELGVDLAQPETPAADRRKGERRTSPFKHFVSDGHASGGSESDLSQGAA